MWITFIEAFVFLQVRIVARTIQIFFFFFFERFILKCMKMKAVTTVFVAIDVSSHFMSLDLN